jgi:hypothetical protein
MPIDFLLPSFLIVSTTSISVVGDKNMLLLLYFILLILSSIFCCIGLLLRMCWAMLLKYSLKTLAANFGSCIVVPLTHKSMFFGAFCSLPNSTLIKSHMALDLFLDDLIHMLLSNCFASLIMLLYIFCIGYSIL